MKTALDGHHGTNTSHALHPKHDEAAMQFDHDGLAFVTANASLVRLDFIVVIRFPILVTAVAVHPSPSPGTPDRRSLSAGGATPLLSSEFWVLAIGREPWACNEVARW